MIGRASSPHALSQQRLDPSRNVRALTVKWGAGDRAESDRRRWRGHRGHDQTSPQQQLALHIHHHHMVRMRVLVWFSLSVFFPLPKQHNSSQMFPVMSRCVRCLARISSHVLSLLPACRACMSECLSERAFGVFRVQTRGTELQILDQNRKPGHARRLVVS